jgi:hypothetical protein
MRLPVTTLVLSLALTGCATVAAHRASGKPIHEFPSRIELGQLAASAGNRPAALPDMARVDVWTIAPESAAIADATLTGQPPAQTPWNALSEELAAKTGAVATPGMRCLAAELARVYVEAGEAPDPGLQRYLTGRCGALAVNPASSVSIQDVPEEVSLEVAFERWKAQLAPDLQKRLQAGEQVGIGLARSGRRVVMVMSKAVPAVTLPSFTRLVDGESRLVLQGQLREPASGLLALVNQGAYAVTHCEVDPAVALPAFRVSCPVAARDEHAWVQLAATPPGRVLANQVLSVLALRSPAAALTYSRQAGAAAPVSDDASFRKAALTLVNRIRASANLKPITLSEPQSVAVSQLVTPFFGAYLGTDPAASDTLNRITLGLMAGWEVRTATIRDASLVVGLDVMTPDAARWVNDALDQPMGRVVLLDPQAEVLALGAEVHSAPSMLAAIAVSYQFFEREQKPGELATSLLERLARVRKARGLGKTTQVEHMVGMAEALADVESGRSTPHEAMESAMYEVARATGQAVSGLVWETHDVEAIEFPPELLRHGNLMLGAGVTFYRPQGGAWGQYTVVFVVIDLPDGGDV